MGIAPYRIDVLVQIRKMFWNHFELVILGVMFSILIISNMFWIAVLLPYGIFTWIIVAQIFYWWIGPRWKARFPRVTKSMLRGEIADLKYRLSCKNQVVKGYFKAIEWHQEEFKRLHAEIEELKSRE